MLKLMHLLLSTNRRAMHNKPYNVDASKITRVLPDFSYIPLKDSARAAADSVVAMGLAAFRPPSLMSCSGLISSIRAALGWSGSAASAAAAEAVAAAQRAVQASRAAAVTQGGMSEPGAIVTAVIVSPGASHSKAKTVPARAELMLSIGGAEQRV